MKSIQRTISALCTTALLAGCGGANQGAIPASLGTNQGLGQTHTDASGHRKTKVRVTIRIPKKAHRHRDRSGHYVSAATKSMTMAFTGPTNSTQVVDLTTANPGCAGTPLVCRVTIVLLSGSYTATIDTYDQVPVAGSIPGSANVLSTAVNVPFVMKGGLTNAIGFTLDGVPRSFVVTPPAGTAGSPFASNAFNVKVYDADGDMIVGAYETPVSLDNGDASGSTTLSTSGSDGPPTGELLGSGDTASLDYTGFPIGPAPISATATGASPATGNFAPTISENIVYNFGGSTQTRSTQGGLVAIGNELYGASSAGGSGDTGSIFETNTSGTGGLLYSFVNPPSTEGLTPEGNMIDVSGNLYGTATSGGTYGGGIAFEMTPTGVETILHSFGNGSDGSSPLGLVAIGNEFYGTTQQGGASGNGTVYEMSTTGTENVIYNFTGGSDASTPLANLIVVGGVLYGTSSSGGANGAGTIFKVSTSGAESVIHSFGTGSDGSQPCGSLVAIGNELYGTTLNGGTATDGTVFKISTSGTESVMHSFGIGSDGNGAVGALLAVGNALYGTALVGGANNNGMVYEVSTAGAESVVYSFGAGSDAQQPGGPLISLGGNLYGMAQLGAANGEGAVFEIP